MNKVPFPKIKNGKATMLVRGEGKICPTCYGWKIVQDEFGALAWCKDSFHTHEVPK